MVRINKHAVRKDYINNKFMYLGYWKSLKAEIHCVCFRLYFLRFNLEYNITKFKGQERFKFY